MEIEDGKQFTLGLIWNFGRHMSVLERKKSSHHVFNNQDCVITLVAKEAESDIYFVLVTRKCLWIYSINKKSKGGA
jgi:hypothetical protein